MGARTSVFPKYTVLDKSYSSSVSYVVGGVGSTTIFGTTSNIVDKNLTTFYKVHRSSSAFNQASVVITCDFGVEVWNCQYYLKNYKTKSGGVSGGTFETAYSADGVSWTAISTAEGDETLSGLAFSLRYFRFSATAPVTSDSTTAEITLYELRLMGS